MSSDLWTIRTHIIKASHTRHYGRGVKDPDTSSSSLRLAVNQYIPKSNSTSTENGHGQDHRARPGDVTIICIPGVGFPKELFEPLFDSLLQRLSATTTGSSSNGPGIRGIWIADAVNQGESFVLNESVIGDEPSYFDYGRDMLHLVNMFQEEMPPPLIALGHSAGTCAIVDLAAYHPRLFTSLVLVDPIFDENLPVQSPHPAHLSAMQRDLFPSRAYAQEYFRRHPMYRRWDKRVFDRWVEHGLRELPTQLYPSISSVQEALEAKAGKKQNKSSSSPPRADSLTGPLTDMVTLKTPVFQEQMSYIRADPPLEGRPRAPDASDAVRPVQSFNGFYRQEIPIAYHKIPYLLPSVLYISGKVSPYSPPAVREKRVKTTGTGVGGSGGVAAGKVGDAVIEKAGHMVPFEKVEETAHAVTNWIWKTLGKDGEIWREMVEAERGSAPFDGKLTTEWLTRLMGKRMQNGKL